MQILVFNITIYVIWQLKEADLKPFPVLAVNIVRLGLFFLALVGAFLSFKLKMSTLICCTVILGKYQPPLQSLNCYQ